MFIRWRRSTLTHSCRNRRSGAGSVASYGEAGDTVWRAELVESVRIDGQPRQRFIEYLVSISSTELNHPRSVATAWMFVYDKIDALKLSAVDKKRVVALFAAKVPKQTRRECAATLRRKPT